MKVIATKNEQRNEKGETRASAESVDHSFVFSSMQDKTVKYLLFRTIIFLYFLSQN